MTDVQQVGSPPKQKRKRDRAQKQPVALPHFDDKDVAKGKKLAATLKSKDTTLKSTQAAIKSTEKKLGELADGLKPIYGQQTLARFAKKIGLSADRLNRCRSVYRAWKNKEIKGPSPKFAVLQALQGHPEREEIIKNKPNLTVREARTFMRDLRQSRGEDYRVDETRRWFAEALKFCDTGHRVRATSVEIC